MLVNADTETLLGFVFVQKPVSSPLPCSGSIRSLCLAFFRHAQILDYSLALKKDNKTGPPQNGLTKDWNFLDHIIFSEPTFWFATPILRLGKEWRTFTYTITST